MATLPPGWAADYDGQRWFYCYTATSHIQYHFPKPGDEFPEFSLVGDYSKNNVLLPEEKLESERQVRKRAALRGGREKTTNGKRNGEGGDDVERQDGKGNGEDEEVFSFESFGYLGPGSCSETMRPGPIKAAQRRPSSGASSKLGSVIEITTGTVEGEGEEDTKPAVSEPSIRNDANVCGQIIEASELTFLPARPCQPAPPDSSFLYNREIAPLTVETIAELVSESTALCEEEINPPPVELPDTRASWLEIRPLPDIVNGGPVELPTANGQLSRHSIPTDEKGKAHRHRQETITSAGADAVDANRSAWCTNWMSTSTSAQTPPPRPPRVISQSNLLSQHDESPQLRPNTTPEEKLHQEILDFFPSVLPPPKEDTKIADDTTKDAFFTMRHDKMRHPSILPNTLSHVPSILRPGPRRSSQQIDTTNKLNSQISNKPSSSQTPEAETSPATNGRPQFRAFQPLRSQHMTTTRKSDPPAPQVIERHSPGLVLNKVVSMPDPKDFVRGTAVTRFKMIEPELKSSH